MTEYRVQHEGALGVTLSPEDIQALIDRHAGSLCSEKAWAEKEKRILQSDDALESWIAEAHGWREAVVRAETYGDADISTQDFARFAPRNPRRPVWMRGSRDHLMYKYSNGGSCSGNGYWTKVFVRWLRMLKFTEFPVRRHFRSEHITAFEAKAERFRTHLDKLGLGVSYHFGHGLETYYAPQIDNDDACRAWVRGKQVYLTKHQTTYLRKMHKIINDTKDIDKRMIKLREYREEERGLV